MCGCAYIVAAYQHRLRFPRAPFCGCTLCSRTLTCFSSQILKDGKKGKAGKAPATFSSNKEGKKKKKKMDTSAGLTGDDRFDHIGKDRRYK